MSYRCVCSHLVLGFEHQQVGGVSEGQAEADDLGLGDVVGKLADVDDSGRRPGTSYVTFELLAVVAIGYRGNSSSIMRTASPRRKRCSLVNILFFN